MDCHEIGTDINVHLRLNCNNFRDPLTYHLMPSSGQIFNLFMIKYLHIHDIPINLSCRLC